MIGFRKIFLLLFLLGSLQPIAAQNFEIELQVRPRAEFRNGFRSLLPEGEDPAFFVSQRSRIALNYEQEAFKTHISFQNVHIWGDNAPTAVTEKNGIKFFEAYGLYELNPALSFKVGRQQLFYDNERIFGALDWAQQGQSHDAFLIALRPGENQQLHMGLALNAEAEELFRQPYTVNTYRNMQFGWYRLTCRLGHLSLLFLNNGYEMTAELTNRREVQYQQTFGTYLKFVNSRLSGDFSAYRQIGERNHRDLKAFYVGGNLDYQIFREWRTGLGAEYLSGTDSNNSGGKNSSFTPLFGAFNGLMDYFYVGIHRNSVGLIDVYGKLMYARQRLQITLVPHFFWSAADLYNTAGQKQADYFGTEIDFSGSYKLDRNINLSFGYSQMFGTESLGVLKGGNSNRPQNWSWLSVSFHPRLFSTKELPAR